MKKNVIIFLVIQVLLIQYLNPQKLGLIEEVSRPGTIQVFNNELYVVDGSTVFVYSLPGLQLERQFGKQGEGPGELKSFPFWVNNIIVNDDFVFLEGLWKYIYFNFEGELIKEAKKPKQFLKMIPVGNNFVVRSFPFKGDDNKFYTAIKIIGPGWENVKELYREPVPMMNTPKLVTMIPDAANFCVWKEKIYIVRSPDGFLIDIFDRGGKLLMQIKKNTKRVKTTTADREQAKVYVRESFRQKKITVFVPIHVVENGWENFKKWAKFQFPEYLPLFQNIVVGEKNIFLQTYKRQNNTDEYLILDLQGKLKKTIHLPQIKSATLWDAQMLGIGTKLYDFHGDYFIYIDENISDETWEVFQLPIR